MFKTNSFVMRAMRSVAGGVSAVRTKLRRPLSPVLMVPVVGLSLVMLPAGTPSYPLGPAGAYAGSTEEGSSGEFGRADREVMIAVGDLPTLRVTPMGNTQYLPPSEPGDGGGGGTRGCETVSSHTDADFGGGSFKIQAGFAEQEVAAAQYTLAATSFPIKIITTEVIVAQQAAIVPTTTKWTMLFWSGRPDTGTLIASYSSDGDILPHITMPPGTNGTNLMFGIDPGDPDQIIIPAPADGSRTFTIGFRIDDHNAQTGSGCGSGDIPSNRNAFPTTDVSGLAASGGNWLKGINCGAFGCPPNGGWARFSALSAACRPSGDWVMRATWEPVDCSPGVGACCLPNGDCQVVLQTTCQSQGGTYKGDGTTCQPGTCPAPTGACCFSNNFCLNLTQSDCSNAGGSWVGPGSQCNGNQCPTGACCLPLGNCVTATASTCAAQGGTFQGIGTSCSTTNCPQPEGACCLSNGFCLELTAADCAGIPGATFKGPLTTCSDGNSNGQADICEPPYCSADFDKSGFVDLEDYTAFVVAFEAGSDNADFDESGFVDLDDFSAFVVAFEAGC